MKLGLGLYRHQLNAEHYQFAEQCGCTHVVVHLADYFRSSRSNQPNDQPVGDNAGWGLAGDPNRLWDYEELAALKQEINDAGLTLEAVESYSRQGQLAYVHFRNVRGKVPCYRETFIDDGDVDMLRVLQILRHNGFDGVLIPDHAPQMACAAPWHARIAYALGYLQAARRVIQDG